MPQPLVSSHSIKRRQIHHLNVILRMPHYFLSLEQLREAAKTRVLSVLKQRYDRGETGLSNTEIRQITHFDRGQVKRLMGQLSGERQVKATGKGRGARWIFSNK